MQDPKEVVGEYLGHKLPFFERTFSPDYSNMSASVEGRYLHCHDYESSRFRLVYAHGNLIVVFDETKKDGDNFEYIVSCHDASEGKTALVRNFRSKTSSARSKASKYASAISHIIGDAGLKSLDEILARVPGFSLSPDGFRIQADDTELTFFFDYNRISYDINAMNDIKDADPFHTAFRYVRSNGHNLLERDVVMQLIARSKKDFWKQDAINKMWPGY